MVFAHQHARWMSVADLEEIQSLSQFLPPIEKQDCALPPPLPGQMPQVFFNQGDKIHALEEELLMYQELLSEALERPKLEASATQDLSAIHEKEIKILKEKIKLLEEEGLHQAKVNKRLEAEKSQLKEMIQDLSKKEIDLGVTIDSQKQNQHDYDLELKDTKSKVVSLQMKIEEIKNLEAEGFEAIEKSKQIQKEMQELKAKYAQEVEQVLRLRQENNLIKEKYQKLHTAYKQIKHELKSSQAGSAINETIVNFSLDSLPAAKDLTLDVNARKLDQEKNLQLLKEVQGHLNEKDSISEEEVQRLTGNLFEIDNSPHWFVKENDNALGPYNFEQMIAMKDQGKISTNCMIRHSKETWKPMSNTYEFCVPYKFSVTQEGDQLIKRFYLKREAVRVPFYELVNLDLEAGAVKGYCTSLSVGGCFIELGRGEMKKVSPNAQVKLELKSDVLSESLLVNAKIVNISEARPRGVGMMFLELSDEGKKVIQTYVNHCLDSADQKKKAA